jgi:hypothetical protein
MDGTRLAGLSATTSNNYTSLTFNSGASGTTHTLTYANDDIESYGAAKLFGNNGGTTQKTLCAPSKTFTTATSTHYTCADTVGQSCVPTAGSNCKGFDSSLTDGSGSCPAEKYMEEKCCKSTKTPVPTIGNKAMPDGASCTGTAATFPFTWNPAGQTTTNWAILVKYCDGKTCTPSTTAKGPGTKGSYGAYPAQSGVATLTSGHTYSWLLHYTTDGKNYSDVKGNAFTCSKSGSIPTCNKTYGAWSDCKAADNTCTLTGSQTRTVTDCHGTKTQGTQSCTAPSNCDTGYTCQSKVCKLTNATCTKPKTKPYFTCSNNTCISNSGCGTSTDGCTKAGGSCGVQPGDTGLSLTIGLDGIGHTGDNANPNWTPIVVPATQFTQASTAGSNQNPNNKTRPLTVKLFDKNHKETDFKGSMIYDATSGLFTSTVNLGAKFATGDYLVMVATDGRLVKQIPEIQVITAGITNHMPRVNLVAGDINNDNAIKIQDYNILMSCIHDPLNLNNPDNGKLCTTDTNYTTRSDFYDNGVINNNNYNLLLREWSVQNGD